jgi:DNA-directed RNA polymerase subunit RPC12/RpoP
MKQQEVIYMRIHIIKDEEGKTIGWTDTKDNVRVEIENWKYRYFCSHCGRSTKDMKFIKEEGYEQKTVTLKCPCGKIVRYGD